MSLNQLTQRLLTSLCECSLSSSPPFIPAPHLCPYLSSGSFQSHPSFSVIDFFILSMSDLPSLSPSSLPTGILFLHLSPPHPPSLYQSSTDLSVYAGINLPLAKPLLDYFFSLFYQCNPFNLLPQQLIKHSNKTCVLPPCPTPCPSFVR